MPTDDPAYCAHLLALKVQLEHNEAKLDRLLVCLDHHIETSKDRDDKVSSLLDSWNIIVSTSKFFKYFLPILSGIALTVLWVKSHIIIH